MRKEGKKWFNPLLYRLRGVAEGIFRGIKTRLNGCFRELSEEKALKMVWLEPLCYNLSIYIPLFFTSLLTLIGFPLKRGIVRQALKSWACLTKAIFLSVRRALD